MLLAIPIVLGVSLVVFITIAMIPGDPVAAMLGPTANAQTRTALTKDLGLDRPLPVQYVKWLGNVSQGDLGRSITRAEPVRPIVIDALKNTLVLALVAGIIAIVGGVILGGIGALR